MAANSLSPSAFFCCSGLIAANSEVVSGASAAGTAGAGTGSGCRFGCLPMGLGTPPIGGAIPEQDSGGVTRQNAGKGEHQYCLSPAPMEWKLAQDAKGWVIRRENEAFIHRIQFVKPRRVKIRLLLPSPRNPSPLLRGQGNEPKEDVDH